MMNLIQLLTDQLAYEGITHSRWGASWNWHWRRVDDDEYQRFSSPEPQTGSKSGLPMKNRRWRRLRIIKHDCRGKQTGVFIFPLTRARTDGHRRPAPTTCTGDRSRKPQQQSRPRLQQAQRGSPSLGCDAPSTSLTLARDQDVHTS